MAGESILWSLRKAGGRHGGELGNPAEDGGNDTEATGAPGLRADVVDGGPIRGSAPVECGERRTTTLQQTLTAAYIVQVGTRLSYESFVSVLRTEATISWTGQDLRRRARRDLSVDT